MAVGCGRQAGESCNDCACSHDSLKFGDYDASGIEKEEMRRRAEAQPGSCCRGSRVGDIQVKEIDLAAPGSFKPMHDGRHSLAAKSSVMKKLDELGAASR